MKKKLMESLHYHDMVEQVVPIVEIDKYQSALGKDSELITISFTVNSREVAKDLSEWFEKGYDWVIDSDISPGEVKNAKHLVFVEIHRRIKSPVYIIEMLEDLKTLTDLDIMDWKVFVGDKEVEPTVNAIGDVLETSPHEYRLSSESELNEWREIAGIETTPVYEQDDSDLKEIQRQAGIKIQGR